MSTKRVSVITVVYNSGNTLEDTIKSVLDQQNDEIDYWIIDGKSTDQSVEIIKKYESRLGGWVSERDKGIFDAMNKGVNLCKGEWIFFLGADDVLLPSVIEKVVPHLVEPNKVVFGDVVFDNGHVMKSSLTTRTLMQNTLHHQGAFYHRSLFDSFEYDQSLPIQADYELNIIIYIKKLAHRYIPIQISRYAIGGNSAGHTEKSYKEINLIRSRHLDGRLKNLLFTGLLRMYYWQKQFRFWLYKHQV